MSIPIASETRMVDPEQQVEQPTEKTKVDAKIDYLDEDPIIPGQEWICISFLSPEKIKNCKVTGFKFRGAFPTQELAEAHAKKIQSKDPYFNIFIGSGFRWIPYNPDPETIEKQEYYEKELNDLMKSVKDELETKKQSAKERARSKTDEIKVGNSKESGKTKLRLQKEALKRKQKTPEEQVAVKEMEEKVIAEKNETEKQLEEKRKDLDEVNNSVHKLEETYAKLLNKTVKH
jgi:hypothetical protein